MNTDYLEPTYTVAGSSYEVIQDPQMRLWRHCPTNALPPGCQIVYPAGEVPDHFWILQRYRH